MCSAQRKEFFLHDSQECECRVDSVATPTLPLDLGVDSYYYEKTKKVMYKVCNICDWSGGINPVFEISRDVHIKIKFCILIQFCQNFKLKR